MTSANSEQGVSLGVKKLCVLCFNHTTTTNSTGSAEVSEVTEFPLRPLADYLGLDPSKLFDMSSMSPEEDSSRIEQLQNCQLLLEICGKCGKAALEFNQKWLELERLMSGICRVVAEVEADPLKSMARWAFGKRVGFLRDGFWAEIQEKGAEKSAIYHQAIEANVQMASTSSTLTIPAPVTVAMIPRADEEKENDDRASNPGGVDANDEEGRWNGEPSHMQTSSERGDPQPPVRLQTEQDALSSSSSSEHRESADVPRATRSQQRRQQEVDPDWRPSLTTNNIRQPPRQPSSSKSNGLLNSARHRAIHRQPRKKVVHRRCSKCDHFLSTSQRPSHARNCVGAQLDIQKCMQAAFASTSAALKVGKAAETTRNNGGVGHRIKRSLREDKSRGSLTSHVGSTGEASMNLEGGKGGNQLPSPPLGNVVDMEVVNDLIGSLEHVSQSVGSQPPPRQLAAAGSGFNCSISGCEFSCRTSREMDRHVVQYHMEDPFKDFCESHITPKKFKEVCSQLLFDEFITAGNGCSLCSPQWNPNERRKATVRIHLLQNHKSSLVTRLAELQKDPELEAKLADCRNGGRHCRCGVYTATPRCFQTHLRYHCPHRAKETVAVAAAPRRRVKIAVAKDKKRLGEQRRKVWLQSRLPCAKCDSQLHPRDLQKHLKICEGRRIIQKRSSKAIEKAETSSKGTTVAPSIRIRKDIFDLSGSDDAVDDGEPESVPANNATQQVEVRAAVLSCFSSENIGTSSDSEGEDAARSSSVRQREVEIVGANQDNADVEMDPEPVEVKFEV